MINKLTDKIMEMFSSKKGSRNNDIGNEYTPNNNQSTEYQRTSAGLQTSKESGFVDFPTVYFRSKWFFPVFFTLLGLLIITIIIRIFFIPDGSLKGMDVTIPEVIYTGEQTPISVNAKGSGSLRNTDFYFESSDDSIIEPVSKAGITGSKVTSSFYTKHTGIATISVYGKLNNISTEVKKQEVAICNRISQDRLATDAITINFGESYPIDLDLGTSSKCYSNITFHIENDNIIRFDDKLNIYAMSAGTTTVTITRGSEKAVLKVSAWYEPIRVTGIDIENTNVVLQKYETLELTTKLIPVNSSMQGISYTSSNTNVASVSNRGVVSANNPGEAIITATSLDGKFTDNITVTVVKNRVVPVRSVALSNNTLSIVKNTTGQLTATISPFDATNKEVNYSSSNEDIAIVSKSGLITGYKAGEVIITVTTLDGSYQATCRVTVTD